MASVETIEFRFWRVFLEGQQRLLFLGEASREYKGWVVEGFLSGRGYPNPFFPSVFFGGVQREVSGRLELGVGFP